MKTKEEYYADILENRKLASDPEFLKCTCPETLCDWHGRCRECVAMHRHYNDHVPFCLQPVIADKIRSLVGVVEMTVANKEGTPLEYRLYAKKHDEKNKNAK